MPLPMFFIISKPFFCYMFIIYVNCGLCFLSASEDIWPHTKHTHIRKKEKKEKRIRES